MDNDALPNDSIILNDKSFTIDWSAINELITLLNTKGVVYYDPIEASYVINGTIIKEKFVIEVISKSSHLINALANAQNRANSLISIKYLQEQKKKE
jgi:hypothetical protein